MVTGFHCQVDGAALTQHFLTLTLTLAEEGQRGDLGKATGDETGEEERLARPQRRSVVARDDRGALRWVWNKTLSVPYVWLYG